MVWLVQQWLTHTVEAENPLAVHCMTLVASVVLTYY